MVTGMIMGILLSIKNLAANPGISVEKAMSMLNVPKADQQQYMEMLEQ